MNPQGCWGLERICVCCLKWCLGDLGVHCSSPSPLGSFDERFPSCILGTLHGSLCGAWNFRCKGCSPEFASVSCLSSAHPFPGPNLHSCTSMSPSLSKSNIVSSQSFPTLVTTKSVHWRSPLPLSGCSDYLLLCPLFEGPHGLPGDACRAAALVGRGRRR